MAKSRMIARSISIDRELNGLSLKSQLIYTWCIPFLDDFGLITNDQGNLKYLVFPRNPHISEDDVLLFITECSNKNLIENLNDCLFFKGFEKHNHLTDYKKSRSEFKENGYNKGKSKQSPEFPRIPQENPAEGRLGKGRLGEDSITVPNGTIIIFKNENMSYEELVYEPLEGKKRKSKFGSKTIFVLVRAYLDAKGIVLAPGEIFDGNKIGVGLSKLYNECKKDPDETIRRLKLGGEYFKEKKLDWTPEAVWRRWEDIKKWNEEDNKFNSGLYE